MAMYARISTLEGSPDQIDEGLRYVRENVLPQSNNRTGSKAWPLLPTVRAARPSA